MIARAKKKKEEETKELDPMENMNVRIPRSYRKRLERRAKAIPGLKRSDIVRMILKAEWDREDARGGK